jgi:hypothetical protein
MLLTDVGLASVLVVLAVFLLWRLVDLFTKDGHWTRELAQSGLLASNSSKEKMISSNSGVSASAGTPLKQEVSQ